MERDFHDHNVESVGEGEGFEEEAWSNEIRRKMWAKICLVGLRKLEG